MNPTLNPTSVLDDIKILADRLFRTEWIVDGVVYNLNERGWKFEFNTKKRALGSCNFRMKVISLSSELIKSNPIVSLWDDTLKHEIAHAIDYHKRGKSDHSDSWKNIGQQVGCSTDVLKSKVKANSALGKYTLKCNTCDIEIQAHRKKKRDSACKGCCTTHNNGQYSDKFKLEVIQNH